MWQVSTKTKLVIIITSICEHDDHWPQSGVVLPDYPVLRMLSSASAGLGRQQGSSSWADAATAVQQHITPTISQATTGKFRTHRNICRSTRYILLPLLHPFDSLFSRTTWLSWHQKGKTFWILLEQEMMGSQWHQLHLTPDNYANISPLSFYRPDALSATPPTVSKHWRHIYSLHISLYLA